MSPDFMEIFVLAAIAGFLVFKLYGVLGQRTGFEPSKRSPVEKKDDLKDQTKTSFDEKEKDLDSSLKELVENIKSHDAAFTLTAFLKGATSAFEMILQAFAKGDIKTLKKLLGKKLYEEFETTVNERKNHGETLETTLIKIESVRLLEGHLQRNMVTLTIEFQTEQIHVIRDKKGEIIDGNPKQIEQLVDLWTFERNLSRSNPNWTLIKTSP